MERDINKKERDEVEKQKQQSFLSSQTAFPCLDFELAQINESFFCFILCYSYYSRLLFLSLYLKQIESWTPKGLN